jgi:hypothetical protein
MPSTSQNASFKPITSEELGKLNHAPPIPPADVSQNNQTPISIPLERKIHYNPKLVRPKLAEKKFFRRK